MLKPWKVAACGRESLPLLYTTRFKILEEVLFFESNSTAGDSIERQFALVLEPVDKALGDAQQSSRFVNRQQLHSAYSLAPQSWLLGGRLDGNRRRG